MELFQSSIHGAHGVVEVWICHKFDFLVNVLDGCKGRIKGFLRIVKVRGSVATEMQGLVDGIFLEVLMRVVPPLVAFEEVC
jgi:hypothetical protein